MPLTLVGPFDPAVSYNELDLSSSTGSKRALSPAIDWLKGCASSHAKCNSNKPREQFYPSRLIDVGCKDAPMLRLCIRDEEPLAGGPYATLSYRRGSYTGKRLLTFNLDEMRMSINPNALPRMFTEAIEVTRAIGLRYLCKLPSSRLCFRP